jgi:hypothetical protein
MKIKPHITRYRLKFGGTMYWGVIFQDRLYAMVSFPARMAQDIYQNQSGNEWAHDPSYPDNVTFLPPTTGR